MDSLLAYEVTSVAFQEAVEAAPAATTTATALERDARPGDDGHGAGAERARAGVVDHVGRHTVDERGA